MLGFRVGPERRVRPPFLIALELCCSRGQAGHCWNTPCVEAYNLIKPLEPLPQARAAKLPSPSINPQINLILLPVPFPPATATHKPEKFS